MFKKGLRRLVVLGINDLAVEAVRFCQHSRIDVRVISAPRFRDLPAVIADPALADTCDARIEALGIPVEIHEKLDTARLAEWAQEDWAAFSFDSPFIVNRAAIQLFDGRVFNEHGANLPQGRGGGGFTWRILDGDKQGRVVFHQLVEVVDAGALAHTRGFLFGPECRKPVDYMRAQMRETLADLPMFLKRLADNDDLDLRPQDERHATYFPRLSTKDQAFIDWSWPVVDIERFVLGFSDPYPGARSWSHGAECIIKDCHAVPARFDAHPFKIGIVFNIVDGKPLVCGRDGTLILSEYQLEGNRELTVGDRLFTPPEKLSAALSRRAVYTPAGLQFKG